MSILLCFPRKAEVDRRGQPDEKGQPSGTSVSRRGRGLVAHVGSLSAFLLVGAGRGSLLAADLNNSLGELWPGFVETSGKRAPLGGRPFLVPEGLAIPRPLSCEARIPAPGLAP